MRRDREGAFDAHEHAPHFQSSSPRKRGSSIPETPMMESRGRGVLDRPVKPDDDSSLWSDRAILCVVPAKAGTHNPWSQLKQKALATMPKRESAAYGSPRARGRH